MQERLMAALTGFFGVLAAVMASLGLYGVMSYAVARRNSEIGIRMALGAQPGDILAMILREASVLLAVGLLLGTGLSLLATRATRTLLFGLEPHDPVTLALAAALLAAVAVTASYLPARRAARLDPMAALRLE
jgi:ABC-type antimicrobial peptide transport system permease subunit